MADMRAPSKPAHPADQLTRGQVDSFLQALDLVARGALEDSSGNESPLLMQHARDAALARTIYDREMALARGAIINRLNRVGLAKFAHAYKSGDYSGLGW
jgi:predicted pyridoxine 5'-phosphate oxidase superfamily flavin-nucleotide-binding protein